MKKFFSAILLMTMMVFSVGTFVSCNDLVTEIEDVKGQTTEQAAAIKALENEIAALETALATAQKAADDAKAAANDAKAAAAQAKADAIADAKAQVEALKTALETAIAEKADKAVVDAMAKDVEAALAVINTSIAKLAEKDAMLDGQIAELLQADAALKAQIEALQAYGKDSSDSLVVELSALQNELDQLWQTIGSETGLQALVGTQAGLIEDLQAELQGLAESIFGEGAESLYTLVGQNAGAIQELLDKMDKVNADIEAINEALSVYNTILRGIVEQIQSVVWVPELNVVAQGYALDKFHSDILVPLTYEVTPKELATKVTSDKVWFNTVEVKAAPAELVYAEVASADANTGRVVVYARIKASNKATVKALQAGSDIALALNIADYNPVMLPDEDHTTVDPGTQISAAYVTVKGAAEKNIAELIKVYNTKKKDWVETAETNTVTAPYTDTAVQSILGIYELRADVQGQAMTIAEASQFLGTTLATKVVTSDFTYTDGTSAVTGKDNVPFTVAKNGYASTAQPVAVKNVALKDAVGYTAETTVSTVTVNNIACPNAVAVTGKLVIDYAQAAITIATYDAGKWSYRTPSAINEVLAVERAVTSSVDVSKLYYAGAPVVGQTIQLIGQADTKDANGKDIKVDGYFDVKVLSSKAAQITWVNVPFLTHEAVYKSRFQLIDPVTNTAYTVAFDVVLGPKPSNKTIDLGTFTANAHLTHDVQVPVGNVISKALAADAAFFADFTKDCPAGTVLNYAGIKGDAAWFASQLAYSINNQSTAGANIVLAYNDRAKAEASYINVAAQAKYDAKYNVKETFDFYGVQYTFTATVQFQKPAYTITPNPVFVKNGVVTLDGTVKIPELTSNKLGLTAGSAYVLNEVVLRDYVNVSDAVKAEIAAGELALVYLFTTTYDHDQNPATPAVSVPGVSIDPATGKVTWEGKAKEYNALDFVVALISTVATDDKGQPIVYGSPVAVQTQVPELVKFDAPASKIVTETYLNGAGLTSANIVKALVVTDVKTGKELYNKYAANLDEIWEGYSRSKTTDSFKSNGVDVFNVYNQQVVINPMAPAKAYLETSKTALTNDDFTVLADGTVTLTKNTGNLTENIIVEVPVLLFHDYCGKAHAATAKVKFSK